MNEQELHPIPAGSVVTEEMVERWMSLFQGGTTRVVAIGTLLNFAEGRGQLPDVAFEDVENRGVFSALRDVYFRQKGMNPPPFIHPEEVTLDEETNEALATSGTTEEQLAEKAEADANAVVDGVAPSATDEVVTADAETAPIAPETTEATVDAPADAPVAPETPEAQV